MHFEHVPEGLFTALSTGQSKLEIDLHYRAEAKRIFSLIFKLDSPRTNLERRRFSSNINEP